MLNPSAGQGVTPHNFIGGNRSPCPCLSIRRRSEHPNEFADGLHGLLLLIFRVRARKLKPPETSIWGKTSKLPTQILHRPFCLI